ncbi:ADP compounds hydrolase NudE [Psychrosphaera sp. B3R10]|uniref:ADP compounds hydrolase NudE n=1 Tax=unclassified Psychrosphaera TaxID=2641570 RepID=UPI001C08E114|nr:MULTISPECIES: ADP compounds hydrolase NudE [unclassified Psychrosphaera]MBU2883785.1 ADP compounds hydrolase NudE [Psychrosphaera sp. I2R16]MBU2990226.1 ADP compounds hydrolase NudE [Psychrosphaera sp. B3R10]MDO6720440.1 ADP compounds hydrolase NudE [Psychrosphaera sp. 1_MG-2023]
MSGKTFENKSTTQLGSLTLPHVHETKLVAESRLFKIEQVELTFSNGEHRFYERMKSSGRGAVMVVPMVNEEQFILVSEYAAGIHSYELGFPKGLIDPGETPEEAANRELKEEIGFGAKRLVKLKTLSIAPSYFNSEMHIFIAFDLYPETLPGDEPEPLVLSHWQLQDSDELMDREDFSEARSVTALFLARQFLTKVRP